MQQQLMKIATNFVFNLDRIVTAQAKERLSKYLSTLPVAQKTSSKRAIHHCPVPGCKTVAHLCKDSGGKKWYMACEVHKTIGIKKAMQYRKARKLSKHLGMSLDDVLKYWDKYRKRYDREFKN